MTDGASAGPKGSKKNRKVGRNKAACAAYRVTNNATFHKARRIAIHLRRYGHDETAIKAISQCVAKDSTSRKAFANLNFGIGTAVRSKGYMMEKRAAKAERQLNRA